MNTPMPFNCHSEDLQIGRYMSRHDSVVTVTQLVQFPRAQQAETQET